MSSKPIAAKVVAPHVDAPGWGGYHEWYFPDKRISVDSLGRPSPRMISANAVKVECNNTDCPAWGFVRLDAIAAMLGKAKA